MLYVDVETLGLHSPLLSIQWAKGFEDPQIHFVWEEDVEETLGLIESFMEETVVMWNGVFDWFHLTKWYNIFFEYFSRYGGGAPNPYAAHNIEQERPTGLCLKPVDCIDLKSVCSKGPYQYLMRHRPIHIRRIPNIFKQDIIELLEGDMILPEGLEIHWVFEKEEHDECFNLRAEFKGGLGLKNVHNVIKPKKNILSAKDVFNLHEVAPAYKPWGGDWQARVCTYFTKKQIKYSLDDIIFMQDIVRKLYSKGVRVQSDVDSKLCIAVGAARWRGFAVRKNILKKIGKETLKTLDVPTAPIQTRKYLSELASPAFKMILNISTNKATLEMCARSKEKELAEAAQKVLKARKDQKLRDVVQKLLEAGTFCPDMKVAGTLTNRMAGRGSAFTRGGSINPQGIDSSLRKAFSLAYPGETLSGGDFDGFEVSIADAVWKSKNLRKALQSGKSVHGIYGASVYGKTYKEIIKTKGTGSSSLYDRSKKSFFAGIYGAQEKKQSEVLGLSPEETRRGIKKFREDHPEIGEHYKKLANKYKFINDDFQWCHPREEVKTILGFKRTFCIEAEFAKACYRLSSNLPESWYDINIYVTRRDRKQLVANAVRSALLGTAFSLQHRVLRVAGNTEIQSPGGEITKALQERLWRHQPSGINTWHIRLLNIHDELMAVHREEILNPIKSTVEDFIEENKSIIPLLSMEWKELADWGSVKV